VQDAHNRRKCRDESGSNSGAGGDCDCTARLEEKLKASGAPFLNLLSFTRTFYIRWGEPGRWRRITRHGAESPPRQLKRLNHRPDITVLENQASAFPRSSDRDIDHGPGQFVGPNHLVREQQPKSGVDRA